MNTNYFLTEGNRENEGYRIFLELEGRALRARRRRAPPSRVVQGPAESFVFFVPSVCVLSAKQQFSSFVCIRVHWWFGLRKSSQTNKTSRYSSADVADR